MREWMAIAAAAMLALAGCAMPSVNNVAANTVAREAPRSTFTLAISRPGADGACLAAWNGEAVTRETLLARGVTAL